MKEIKVSHVMNKEVKAVSRATSLRSLLAVFKEFHTLPLIPVVTKEQKLIGIVSLENLLDILRPQQAKLFRHIPFVEIDHDFFDLEEVPSVGALIIVDDIMDNNFIVVAEDEPLEQAYRLMRLHKQNRLPVVDAQGNLLGIVGIFDIIWRMFKEKGIV